MQREWQLTSGTEIVNHHLKKINMAERQHCHFTTSVQLRNAIDIHGGSVVSWLWRSIHDHYPYYRCVGRYVCKNPPTRHY